MNKILTLDDLVKFCAEQKVQKFSSKEAGYKLRVQIPAKFEMDEEEESTSTLFAHVQVMHTGRNRNGSNLTEKAARDCLKTMAYKPLLANFCEIDGVKDFTSHDYYINDNGEIEYLEKQVGCITADAPYIEDDKEVEGRKNIFAKVAIPREYTDAAEIIERKNGTKVSAELEINSMSYDSKEKELRLEEVELIGLTCLGLNPETGEEVQEGMEGAHIQLEDFSATNNSLIHFMMSEEFKKFIQDSIEESLNKNLGRKEGNAQMEFEENANVTETSEETVTEEFVDAESSEEILDEKTATEESTEESTVTEAESTDDIEDTPSEDTFEADVDSEDTEDEDVDTDSEEKSEEDEEVEADETEESESEEDADEDKEVDSELNSLKMSVNINGEKMEFEVSLRDKMNALYELVNSTYGESDNDYYDIDAYEDSKTVVMHGWFSGKHYRQQYAVKKDVYSLKGDRVEVYAQYLTQDEISQLDSMKQSYAENAERLAKYESEPDKIAVLESKDYTNLEGNEAFESLKKQESHFDLSVEELKSQCDAMLLEYAKGHKVEFEAESEKDEVDNKPISFKHIIPESPNKKAGKYGGIFRRN